MATSTVMFTVKVWGCAFLLLSQHVHARRVPIEQLIADELTSSSDEEPRTSVAPASLLSQRTETKWFGKGFIDSNKWPFKDCNQGKIARNVRGNAHGINQNANAIEHLGNVATANANQAGTNAANIAANTQAVNGLGVDVASNAGNIAANTDAIGSLAANQAANSQTLNAVADLSMANTDAISAVGNHAAANTDALNSLGNLAIHNAEGVAQNTAQLNMLGAQATANADLLATNAGNIAGNTAAINQLGSNVVANSANIAANTQTINAVADLSMANTDAILAVGNHAAANTQAINAVANHAMANTQAISAVGQVAAQNAAGVAANSQAIGVLGTTVAANSAEIASLTTSVGMLSGSVATNTAAIASLTAEVAVLSEAAAPTVALASALGVSVETVATLSLAGSFAGPLIGCILLVYVCWPQEETDPWLKIEARVARMINDRFDEERRKRLSSRLRRYIMEFSRCSHAWTAKVMTHPDTQPVQSLLQQVAHQVSGGEIALHSNTFAGAADQSETDTIQSVPACMAQLEGHMSLERDEWLSAEGDSLSSLFMPFANMHTQILALLADYSPDSGDMMWPSQQKMAAGEYASFMLDNMLKAWKSQMCRTMRVRHSMKTKVWQGQFFKWRYEFVVLKPIWQPNAGEYCKEQCGSTGWCNFCGGRDVGACCILGGTQGDSPQDPSECAGLVPPRKRTWPYSPYHTCMSTDCIQSNMYFTSSKELEGPHETDMYSETGQCQEFCRLIPGATVFNFEPVGDGFKCKCLGGKDATIDRYYWKGAFSGPTVCPKKSHAKTEEQKAEMPAVPMEQVHPCEKSPLVNNIEELEKEHPEWIKQCYTNATKVVAKDFNPFYRRFATFVDKLAYVSGCQEGKTGTLADWDDEDWSRISDVFEFGTFDQCDWKREEKRDDGVWQADNEFEQGLTGTSRINVQSQSKLKTAYPAPHWLERLRGVQTCLAEQAAGLYDKDGVGAAAFTILQDPLDKKKKHTPPAKTGGMVLPAGEHHCAVPKGLRKDCGAAGMQQQECEAKGCCWKEAPPGVPWCFHGSRSDGIVAPGEDFDAIVESMSK